MYTRNIRDKVRMRHVQCDEINRSISNVKRYLVIICIIICIIYLNRNRIFDMAYYACMVTLFLSGCHCVAILLGANAMKVDIQLALLETYVILHESKQNITYDVYMACLKHLDNKFLD